MLLIFKSLLIVLGISTAFGLISYYAFNSTFTGVFLVTMVLQFIISYFFNTWTDLKNNRELADREAELLKEFNKQGAEVPCAYCGEPNYIPIRTDVPNDYECGKCNKENAVYISITGAQKTNPLQSSPLEVMAYNTQLQEAKDKILDSDEAPTADDEE